ncbi:unnamed protein product [Leptidea sinapis]|uniref:Uncharacterized protein n=1 Tax=Leptidea sinapis TaxID=189913 RepID=A0A5E4QGL1_9NEOP|nr:unnamed protein product [Leptidea sinapis]
MIDDISNIKTSPKEFWKFIKNKRTDSGIPHNMYYGSSLLTNGHDICNAFNEYFKPSDLNDETLNEESNMSENLHTIEIDERILRRLFSKLDIRKGADYKEACNYHKIETLEDRRDARFKEQTMDGSTGKSEASRERWLNRAQSSLMKEN